jgi:quinol monooxygenase YgiN
MASVKQAWIRKYGEEEGLRRYEELNKDKGSLNWYIDKYGITDGPAKYYDKNKKLSVSIAALRINGKTDDEIATIRNKHSNKSRQTLSNMIERYGEEEGRLRYEQYRHKNKLTSNRRLEYWIKRCNGDVEQAKIKLKNWQTRDLQWFINKYGDIDGLQRYNNMNGKRGRLLENYIRKYGKDVGLEKYLEACKNWKEGQRGIFNSSGQLEVEDFLNTIFENVKGSRNETGIILTDAEKTKELQNNTLYPDIIVNDKYIIQYNGDFWHANKTLFPDDSTVVGRVKKTAGLIREIDRQKNTIYVNRGYIVINIWDSDWQTNKDKIKQYLKQEIQ